MTETTQTTAAMLAEAVKPTRIVGEIEGSHHLALPPGWTHKNIDESALFSQPRRKNATVFPAELDSFVDYVNRHKSGLNTTIWCQADFQEGDVTFTALINDHAGDLQGQQWRDHKAVFDPRKSAEWNIWDERDKEHFSQIDFALFIEDRLQDIAPVEGLPTGTQMLDMATKFEAHQDSRFKQAIRLQSGGVQLEFVQDDDAGTVERMKIFERFAIGIPVFWNGPAYRIEARLRYRANSGRVVFWYELIRPDKVLEAAAQELIATIKDKTAVPFFFGNPGV